MPSASTWMTRAEACTHWSIHKSTLYRWAAAGKIERKNEGDTVYFKDKITNTADFKPDANLPIDGIERHGQSYLYDKDRQRYTIWLPSMREPLHIHSDIHEWIVASYSNWTGKGDSINAISRKLGWTRRAVREYLAVFGVTHDSPPWSREKVSNTAVDVLVGDLVASRTQDAWIASQAALEAQDKVDAAKWRTFQASVLDRFEAIASRMPPPEPVSCAPVAVSKPFIVVCQPTDLHYGKLGWTDETGEEYSRDITAQRLIKTTQLAIQRILRWGRPEKWIVGCGGDWFHIDTIEGTTTAGTPQDTDGTYARVLIEGCRLMEDYVQLLRCIAPVEVVMTAGNHDRSTSLTVLLYLNARYRDAPDVSVRVSPANRQYIEYGASLICLTHGDMVRPRDLPGIMSVEQRPAWGRTQHHYVFSGHLHQEIAREYPGCKVFTLPSLSGVDRWHAEQGYVGNTKGLQAFLIDHSDGVIAQVFTGAS